MKFKHVAVLVLCAALLLPQFRIDAQAEGDGNIDHGGGSGMGNGGQSWWNGDDGVRVTVVRTSDNKPVSRPVDFTNYNESGIQYYFLPKSKLHYRNGSQLQGRTGAYKCIKPDHHMPQIITQTGTSNISAIRKYFCSDWVIRRVAQAIGTSYEKLTDGKYKLLLEPVAYFFFHGRHKYAMTATEAALYPTASWRQNKWALLCVIYIRIF